MYQCVTILDETVSKPQIAYTRKVCIRCGLAEGNSTIAARRLYSCPPGNGRTQGKWKPNDGFKCLHPTVVFGRGHPIGLECG
uniref:Uncharacterized protein n=1 Tax=Anguilla anguilla TaxID=7936 RepID=A0A0E9PLG6_ANGAN